ncbi:hypothetical protein [Streptomyces sp. NPDC008122]|uniref:hypothetical protein n=1 Tax=Streptomyces sp. NPDC008122 TaxID=3364810 RepID=UPI0036E9642A
MVVLPSGMFGRRSLDAPHSGRPRPAAPDTEGPHCQAERPCFSDQSAGAAAFDPGEHGVCLVDKLPEGFPPFTIPEVRLADLFPLLGGALGIPLVPLVDTISDAFGARQGQEVRGNHVRSDGRVAAR